MTAFEWTDDPVDPCGYCVQFDPPPGVDPMTAAIENTAVPLLADGSVAPRVFRGAHPACDDAVATYVEQSEGL